MTVIAYRDGVMAADNLLSDAARIRVGRCQKIARSPQGHLGGAAGNSAAAQRFSDWVKAGTEGHFKPDAGEGSFVALLAFPDGRIRQMSEDGTLLEMETPFYAIGCGRFIALGAMYAGATPEESVLAAIALDSDCGGDVQVERLS